MARKVFISFLGYSNYGYCHYVRGDYKSSEVRYVQEATLDYLTQKEKWTNDDIALILLTEGAEKANWNDDGHKDRNTGDVICQSGLQSQLATMNLSLQIKPIRNLPDGNNETEIWEIFNRVFEEIKEGDCLYFDLTHGFRYLPMLTIVLANYAKFLKGIKVCHMSYGNFEGRDRKTNEALLVDLMPLTSLQDWTFAAANFIHNGYVKGLVELANSTVRPLLAASKGTDMNAWTIRKYSTLLEQVVDERLMCRGISIIESDSYSQLHSISEEAANNTVITPLQPVIRKINDSISSFLPDENIKNGIESAKWCLKNNLYQQAITIIQETVTTYICMIAELDWKNRDQRELVNKAFKIHFNKTEIAKWSFSSNLTEQERLLQEETICKLLSCDELHALSSSFSVCTDIRNDFNHAGMRENPTPSNKLRKNIEERINKIDNILYPHVD